MGWIPGLLACLLCVLLLASSTEADYNLHYNCTIYGDPHLRTYKNACGRILIPCRLRATHLVNKMTVSGRQKWCETNVYTSGRVIGRGVYTGAAEIEITIYSFDSGAKVITKTATFVVSDKFLQSDHSALRWGELRRLSVDTFTVTWSFNKDGAVLVAPGCGFSLWYRLSTVHPSGIIIKVSYSVTISPGYHHYVFCGDRNDTLYTLLDDAHSLQLHTAEEGLAYRILTSNESQNLIIPRLTQRFHPNAIGCNSTKSYFQGVCQPSARPVALKTCLDIFSKRHLLKCLNNSGETNPLTVFQSCLRAYCERSTAACNDFRYRIQPCQSQLTSRLRVLYSC